LMVGASRALVEGKARLKIFGVAELGGLAGLFRRRPGRGREHPADGPLVLFQTRVENPGPGNPIPVMHFGQGRGRLSLGGGHMSLWVAVGIVRAVSGTGPTQCGNWRHVGRWGTGHVGKACFARLDGDLRFLGRKGGAVDHWGIPMVHREQKKQKTVFHIPGRNFDVPTRAGKKTKPALEGPRGFGGVAKNRS